MSAREIDGIGIELAKLAAESFRAERDKRASRLLERLYPTPETVIVQHDARPADLSDDDFLIVGVL